MDDAVLMKNE